MSKKNNRASKNGRRSRQAFRSNADTPEMRIYQEYAAKFPPLSYPALCEHSRTFIKGRNAQVTLEEHKLVTSVVGDDFSDEHLLALEEEIMSLYISHINWISGKKKPAVILTTFIGNDPIEKIYERIHENMLASPAYTGEATMSQMYPLVCEMSLEEFAASTDKIRTACLVGIEEAVPKDVPKDVVDRWKERKDLLTSHFLTAIRSLDLSCIQLEHLERDIERGTEALEAIVNHNLQLAMHCVKKELRRQGGSYNSPLGALDLIGAANLGLTLGARQFDPDMGRQFSTYAIYHINAQIREATDTELVPSGIMGPTQHERKQSSIIDSTRAAFEKIYDRLPTLFELQSLTGISSSILEKRIAAPRIISTSLDAPVKNASDDSDMTLEDTIKSDVTVEEEFAKGQLIDLLQAMKEEIASMGDIYKGVICGKSGISLDGSEPASPKSIKQIARECHIAPSDVNKRYEEAKDILRGKLEARGYSQEMLPM